jgi:hypothetical protein
MTLPLPLAYPPGFPVTYQPAGGGAEAACIEAAHCDGTEPFYTVRLIERDTLVERQTVRERLSSWVDALPVPAILRHFAEFHAPILISGHHLASGCDGAR